MIFKLSDKQNQMSMIQNYFYNTSNFLKSTVIYGFIICHRFNPSSNKYFPEFSKFHILKCKILI